MGRFVFSDGSEGYWLQKLAVATGGDYLDTAERASPRLPVSLDLSALLAYDVQQVYVSRCDAQWIIVTSGVRGTRIYRAGSLV
jgi:hypothetical protein